ncbi:MAG: hypothetical protein Q9227_003255 [Pyrenula ochraceoflavens]
MQQRTRKRQDTPQRGASLRWNTYPTDRAKERQKPSTLRKVKDFFHLGSRNRVTKRAGSRPTLASPKRRDPSRYLTIPTPPDSPWLGDTESIKEAVRLGKVRQYHPYSSFRELGWSKTMAQMQYNAQNEERESQMKRYYAEREDADIEREARVAKRKQAGRSQNKPQSYQNKLRSHTRDNFSESEDFGQQYDHETDTEMRDVGSLSYSNGYPRYVSQRTFASRNGSTAPLETSTNIPRQQPPRNPPRGNTWTPGVSENRQAAQVHARHPPKANEVHHNQSESGLRRRNAQATRGPPRQPPPIQTKHTYSRPRHERSGAPSPEPRHRPPPPAARSLRHQPSIRNLRRQPSIARTPTEMYADNWTNKDDGFYSGHNQDFKGRPPPVATHVIRTSPAESYSRFEAGQESPVDPALQSVRLRKPVQPVGPARVTKYGVRRR